MALESTFENIRVFASSNAVASLLLTVVVILVGGHFTHVAFDPAEPPVIPHWFPIIGHMFGMLWYGGKYAEKINEKYDYPIFTLQTLRSRTYIVTSPVLAAIIQRSSKSLSFYKPVTEFGRRFAAMDEPSMRIIRFNMDGGAGEPGVMPETHDMLTRVLGPGAALDRLTEIQLNQIANTVNDTIGASSEGVVVGMHDWIRRLLSVSNAFAIYGPENPFEVHPELVDSFWEFEEGLIPLLVGVLPAITARKAYCARQKLFDGLVEFLKKEQYKMASELAQRRIHINFKNGFTLQMAAQIELSMLWAIIANAVPTTFWLLANIFSRPSLLSGLREEVARAVKDESGTRTIHVAFLKSSCPLLISTYRETLRTISISSSIRMTLADTMISDKYLLKKDSVIQIAGGVLHTDKEIWGNDADTFNPNRFMPDPGTPSDSLSTVPLPSLPKNVPSAAFRAFGGGSIICPGRHFAQSEIVGFAAAMLLGFDITDPPGGPLTVPKKDESGIPLVVLKPAEECRVNIKRREGMEGVRWALKA